MTKRKPVTETPDTETTPPERVHKAGGQAEVVSGERWHILYTPQWRAQVDLGEFVGDVQLAGDIVIQYAEQTRPDNQPAIDAHFTMIEYRPGITWHLVGSDGVVDSNTPFAILTRVIGGAK